MVPPDPDAPTTEAWETVLTHLVRSALGRKTSTHPDCGLDEVFRLHRAGLVRVAAFILGDRGAAEDVVQDVFVRVHERAHLMGDGDPQYYLRAAVVNGCRTTLRRRRLVRRHAEHLGEQSACPPLTTEEAAMLGEDRRRVLLRRARMYATPIS